MRRPHDDYTLETVPRIDPAPSRGLELYPSRGAATLVFLYPVEETVAVSTSVDKRDSPRVAQKRCLL